MFFRLFYLVSACFGYGKFQSPISRYIYSEYRVKDSPLYSIKCYAVLNPIRVLVFMFLIPGILVLGIGVRIFERSMDMPGQNFEYLGNAM